MSSSQEFHSRTNPFGTLQMSSHGYMMRNRPLFSNNSQMCFPQNSMNMMGSSKLMSETGFNLFWNTNPMLGPLPMTGVQKEVLTFPSSVLYPPPPDYKLPSPRDRPPGCKTIFVGGLPKNITEAHLKEIFERSGEISSLQLRNLSFAHIRFTVCASVERALYISGYYMKIANRDDPSNCGRLHVDYSFASEDQIEYECEQRELAQQMKFRQNYEAEQWPPRPTTPQSPPKPVIYNENEAADLQEELKKDETMIRAINIIITWLERGACTRKTVNVFYGLLQTVNSNVRRLMTEKETQEEEIRKLQETFENRFSKILTQFEHVEKVFKSACKQKSWDHFTKAQRKNIDFWSKQIQEIRTSQQEEFFNKYQDHSMEMSDGEDGEPGISVEPASKKKKSETDIDVQHENEALKCQLEAYKNEIDMAKQESLNSLEMKNKEIKGLQLALQGMQKQLIASRQQSSSSEKSSSTNESTGEINENDSHLEIQLREKEQEIEMLYLALQGMGQTEKCKTANSTKSETLSMGNATSVSVVPTSQKSSRNDLSISQNQLKLISLISCFLNVHPMGASPDYISSYLKQMQVDVCANEIEELLDRLPSLFKQEVSGCGASIKRQWKFTGFHN